MATARYKDLVLTFHQVHPRAFELSGLRTGSLRDQMLRATLLVERLVKERLLGPTGRMLIVGAGAAGVAAAIRASELGVDTVVLEKERWAFGAQSESTRLVDPTEYDWPQPHWRTGRFVVGAREQDLPLAFRRSTAQDLAGRWQRHFAVWINSRSGSALGPMGAIEVRHRRDLVPLAGTNERFECWADQDSATTRYKECDIVIADDGVHLIHADPAKAPEEFAILLSCIGFGSETVSVPNGGTGKVYAGPRFWEPDQLEDLSLGLPHHQGLIRVLVSGGGDGAQQDIQRALTRSCGRDLYNSILEVDPAFEQKIDFARAAMADDDGRRAHAWRAADDPANRSLRRWHLHYAGIARRVWRLWTPDQQAALCQYVLRESVTVHLFWVLGGSAPGYSFGLNRLLTYLVLLMHERHTGRPFSSAEPRVWAADRPIVVRRHRVTRVEPVGHQCQSHSDCHGKLHRVYCSDGRAEHLLGEFDVVVIRHGAVPKPMVGQPTVPEQFVPFRFPR